MNPMMMGEIDGRDSRSESSKDTYQLSKGGTENTDSARRDEEGHLNDNISAETDCDNLESAIPDENDNEFEGDDTSYQEFNDHEPKSYSEAASDIRWIKAMNQEMEALNRNGTWIITDLHVGRKPIGSKPCGTPIDTKESTAKPKKVVVDNPLTCINNYQKLVGYKAMNTITCEVIWIQKILAELNVRISLLVLIHCDNSSAIIQIAANSVFHEKTKHFEIELFLLREKVSAGVVKTVKVKYANNVADVFTKRFECSRSR
ncbi:hypothetical protein Tco_0300169 [Tanacetum coccineum]